MGDNVNAMIHVNVGFVGAGVMAKAIGEGLLKSGLIEPSRVYAASPGNLENWKVLGVNVSSSNSYIVHNCPVVILAVKPQFATPAIAEAFKDFEKCSIPSVTVVSILAGLPIATIKKMIHEHIPSNAINRVNVIRAMPNTPILVGEGCTVYSTTGPECNKGELKERFEDHKRIVHTIFSVNGFCEEVSENLINSIGALSGSGPAYAFLMIEAFSDGAVKMGVPRALAYTLAAQTLLGASKMVLTTGKHPGELKDEVCSPGGTTIAAISVMEKCGIRSGLIQALEAANQRSEEIAKKS